MCLIVFVPDTSSTPLNDTYLERGFDLNNDGAGFTFLKNGKLVTRKGYKTYIAFKKALGRVRENLTGPLLIHFRLATCGPKNKTNSQPIDIIDGKLAMAHNGVFFGLSYENSKISDSVRLARIVKGLGWTLPFSKHQIAMLDALCGEGSKLVFINNVGASTIINEAAGTWKKDIWYSNEHSFTEKNMWARRAFRAKGDAYDDDDGDERDADELAFMAAFDAMESNHPRLPANSVMSHSYGYF